MTKTIGIFGPSDDQEVCALRDRLHNRGVEPWIVDFGTFPTKMRIEFDRSGVTVDGRSILDMDAAYLRKTNASLPDYATYSKESISMDFPRWKSLHDEAQKAYRREKQNHPLRTGVIEFLKEKRPVVNPPQKQNLHRQKAVIFSQLLKAKVPCPSFALGMDRERLNRFAKAAFKKWSGAVVKPPAGIYKTKLWTEDEWRSHPFHERPALYQRYIKGDTVRCYVVGGRLVSAARIVHGGTVDSSMSQTGIEVTTLDPSHVQIAEEAAKALDLEFCGMDLMLDEATSEAFVIDVNMSPMFVNYIKLSGHDIAGHLANLLIARTKNQDTHTPPKYLSTMEDAKNILENDPELTSLLQKRLKSRKKER